MKKNRLHVYLTVLAILLGILTIASTLLVPGFWSGLLGPKDETGSTQEPGQGSPAEVVGIEVYDLSLYEESSEEYVAALAQMEEDWFPRPAVVIPKGPEGGDYPNAPAAIYDAFPGQQAETEEGDTYEITRTWIGDIAVGTKVILEGVVQQGEWCFVIGETIGGWSSSGWVWCYRLIIPE